MAIKPPPGTGSRRTSSTVPSGRTRSNECERSSTQTLLQLLFDIDVVAEFAALADVADVIGEGPVGAEELVRHFQIFAEQFDSR